MKARTAGLLAVTFFAASFTAAYAQHVKLPPKKADRNHDGVVDRKEAHQAREREHRAAWLHNKARVNGAVEAKYDANHDGYLEPAEAREMLKDKDQLIKTHGKAKVDNALEAQYDLNKDGILDANEAKALNADLKN